MSPDEHMAELRRRRDMGKSPDRTISQALDHLAMELGGVIERESSIIGGGGEWWDLAGPIVDLLGAISGPTE